MILNNLELLECEQIAVQTAYDHSVLTNLETANYDQLLAGHHLYKLCQDNNKKNVNITYIRL